MSSGFTNEHGVLITLFLSTNVKGIAHRWSNTVLNTKIGASQRKSSLTCQVSYFKESSQLPWGSAMWTSQWYVTLRYDWGDVRESTSDGWQSSYGR
jgi:hypothetical protein